MPGDLLDVILVALAALFAAAGYREGFIVGVTGCVGFLAGAAAGVAFAPEAARFLVHGAAAQAVSALIMVFITAALGQLLASLAGVAARRHLIWRPSTLADALGGAAVSVVSVLFIAGFIGSGVAGAPPSGVSRQVDSSVILRGVDKLLPPAVFPGLRSLLGDTPYAPLLGPLGLDGRALIAPADRRVLGSSGLVYDKPSIVKVIGEVHGCRPGRQGTGFVFAPHHILTNAHVVAGVTGGPWVVSSGKDRPVPARVVLFDPRRDVAVLYVPELNVPPLRFARHAGAGSDAIVAGYPRGQPFTAVAARVGTEIAPPIRDIYQTATVIRDIYWIRAIVEPGNSGGPLLAPNGTVYGMVFAVAPEQRGYALALTTGEVMPDARAAAAATTPVSTQSCIPLPASYQLCRSNGATKGRDPRHVRALQCTARRTGHKYAAHPSHITFSTAVDRITGPTGIDSQVSSSTSAVSSPPASPVLMTVLGSNKSTAVSVSAHGQCSTPRGTTKSSRGASTTLPSRS